MTKYYNMRSSINVRRNAMKRTLVRNGIWILLPIGTFMLGLALAPRYRAPVESLTVVTVVDEPAPPPRPTYPTQREAIGMPDYAPQPDKEAPQIRAWSSDSPLSDSQLEAVVLDSIRSSDPLERRRAFDRLLQEMQTDTFTVEQAMHMRSLMRENGASGEQWRLFDYAWAANDPEAAIAHIDEIPEDYRNGFLSNMLPGLASADPQSAVDLFQSFDSNLQGQLRPRLYEGLIDHDIELATNYVFDAADPERPDWRHMDTFTRELANEQGIDQVLKWAADLPEGSLRGNAWSAAYAKWTSEDPLAVSEAILDLPPSADRDQAINGFVSALAGQDPEAAVLWAAEISGDGLRESAMVRVGTRYFQQEPSAAAAWFESSGLPHSALIQMGRANKAYP